MYISNVNLINYIFMQRPRILFIHDGNFSFVNQHVRTLLSDHFKQCEVESFDIRVNIKQKKRFFLINVLFFIWEYRSDLIFRYKNVSALKSSLFVTTYIQQKIKSIVTRMVVNDDYLFTFQTQSQYDASVPGTPHYVYTDHTLRANFLYPNVDYRRLMKPNQYLLCDERKIYERASLTFTYSKNIKDSLLSQYDITPSRVATVGVGYSLPSPPALNPEKYASQSILFVGLDWQRKGGPLLLEAFILVQQQVPDVTLTIVGCCPVVDKVPNVSVIGKVSLPEVCRFYEQSAVFCMPSHREPFGLVYLEAMLYQLPIVALSVGALPELVSSGHNGYLTQAKAPALAEQLMYLVQHPNVCQEMGSRSAKVVERYQWKTVGTRLACHIKEDLKEHEGGGVLHNSFSGENANGSNPLISPSAL